MLRKGIYLGLGALVFAGLFLFSGCHRSPRFCRFGEPEKRADLIIEYVTEDLELNETQRENLNGIKDEMLDKGREMHTMRQTMMEEVLDQLRSDQIDRERLNALITQHKTEIDAMISLMVDRLADFHATLTPEQRAKLCDRVESHMRWHRLLRE